jgi:hypothetical protein
MESQHRFMFFSEASRIASRSAQQPAFFSSVENDLPPPGSIREKSAYFGAVLPFSRFFPKIVRMVFKKLFALAWILLGAWGSPTAQALTCYQVTMKCGSIFSSGPAALSNCGLCPDGVSALPDCTQPKASPSPKVGSCGNPILTGTHYSGAGSCQYYELDCTCYNGQGASYSYEVPIGPAYCGPGLNQAQYYTCLYGNPNGP